MISPNRIEAAARALGPTGLSPERERAWAEEILTASYPELANGTAWLAPRVPTDAMLSAGSDMIDDPSSHAVDAVYTAMRDAFLQEPKDNAE